MKKLLYVAVCLLATLLLYGCIKGKPEESSPTGKDGSGTDATGMGGTSESTAVTLNSKITNRKIPVTDITDFYYNVENINFNAYYQRYRFYVEDGKFMFLHETRQIENDYGPTSEKDRTRYGVFELTEEEWLDFIALIQDGEVVARTESMETGDEGPRTYLYWKGDKGKYQEFSFPSYGVRQEFVAFCEALAER